MAAQVGAVPMLGVHQAPQVLKRKHESQELEDDQVRENKRLEMRYDQFRFLCARLSLELSDGISVNGCVDRIFLATPDIAYLLSDYRKQELETDIALFLADSDPSEEIKDKLKKAVMLLYSTCLLNSRYGKTVATLEQDLPALAALLETGPKLIENAEAALALPLPEGADALQELRCTAARLMGRLQEYANIFIYGDPDHQERIMNIYTFAKKPGGRPQFPVCLEWFPKLKQKIAISQHEEKKAQELKRALFQLSEVLRFRVAALMEQRSRLSKAREDLLNYQAVALWDCGTSLLEDAFCLLFRERRTVRSFIPGNFVNSIRLVSQSNREFRFLTFNELLRRGLPVLPPRYVSEVWRLYLSSNKIADTSDLIRFIVSKMPDEAFQQLEAAFKGAGDKQAAALKAIMDFMKTQVRGPLTLVALKHWIEKNP